jgi:hypothetical protein
MSSLLTQVVVNRKETYASGAVYEGGFSGKDRHGYGTLIDGSKYKYEGKWQLGVKHGHGREETRTVNTAADGK